MTKKKPSRSSPLSGGKKFSKAQQKLMAARRTMPSPAQPMDGLVAGGIYGTDGANLYLIDKNTGAASLIGPHGPVEFAIGALAFDGSGVLYGISLTEAAQLYTIDVNTGAVSAVGPLDIGFIFEGGLSFDPNGRLIGVDQDQAGAARTFEINTATGAATIIGPPNGQRRDLNGLTREGDVVYGIDRLTDSFGRLDVISGTYIPLGATGTPVGDTGGLVFCPADGKFYATFAADGGFYTIDKATGAASLIAINKVDYGLAIAPQEEAPQRFSYSVKFVCGMQENKELAFAVTRPGLYATEINIHNYHDKEVTLRKFVLPVVYDNKPIGREPEYVRARGQDSIVLPPNTATMDDCYRIAELIYSSPPPDPMPFTVGYLEIVSPKELAVDAVYTVTGFDGQTISIDVERVEGKVK